MIEHTHQFGTHQHLSAISSSPTHGVDVTQPTVVLLNAGILHKPGAFRMNTNLAREIARLGFRTIRFDLPGIGDSLLNREQSGPKSDTDDIRQILDFCEERFLAQSFILIGLCTGADNAHRTALNDDRVVAAAFLDGIAYETPRFYRHRYLGSLTRGDKWRALMRRANLFDRAMPTGEKDAFIASFTWSRPTFEQAEKEITQLVDRGVHLYYIFSGGVGNYYNYAEQFEECFSSIDFRGLLTVSFFQNADHTYILQRDQKQLISALCDWIARRFPTTVSTIRSHQCDREGI